MADRHLSELSRAFQQNQFRLERRITQLEGSRPGAMRSAYLDSYAPAVGAVPTAPTKILSMEVSSGRWAVQFRARVVADLAPKGATWLARLTVQGESGILVPGVSQAGVLYGRLPQWQWYNQVEGFVRAHSSDFGDFVGEETSEVGLEVWTNGVDESLWLQVLLHAYPV